MSFLALDLGTTFIKGAVLDLDQLRLGQIRRLPFPAPVAGLPALFYEVDPMTVVATVRQLILELLAYAPDCTGIVLCTQMHGLVLCTSTGVARSNLITWQDQRILTPHRSGGAHLERLRTLITPQERQQLGNELQPSRPLCYLYWMAENGKLSQEPLIPAALPDFVIANLAGITPTIEPTNAGAHGAFNLETFDWHHAVIERLGLAHLQWPRVRPIGGSNGAAVGEVLIAGRRLPCYTAIGDHQCALVGAFLGLGELSLNISTGSQVSLLTPQLALGDYQTRPFFDGRFLNTVTGVPAGRALNHLVNLITEPGRALGIELPDPWGYIAERAAATPATDLEVNLSFFDSPGGRFGHIVNIQEHNLTVGHLFRAAFENMAHNYLTSAHRLHPAADWARLVFSGGLAQKITVLREIIKRKFGLPYRLCATSEDTLLGLLALALVADGRMASVAEATQFLLAQSETSSFVA